MGCGWGGTSTPVGDKTTFWDVPKPRRRSRRWSPSPGRQPLSGPERGAECPVPACACERPTAVQAGERWRRRPEQRRRSPAGSPAGRTVGPCHWKHVEVLVGAAGDTKLEPLARRTPCCQRRGARRNPRDQSCSDGVSGGPRGTAHTPAQRCGLAGPAGDSPRSRRLSVAGT